MSKQAKRVNINYKVVNIATLSGLELTVDYNSTNGGWRLEEGSDFGGVSTSKFGETRRTYPHFIDYLDTIILGFVLAHQKENA